MKLKLLPNWKYSKEIYNLKNDQNMKNIGNLVSPCGKVVSVFFVDEDPKVGLFMFNKMLRDYNKITRNLKLLMTGKIKVKERIVSAYIVMNKDIKTKIVHLFFEKEDKLYILIFNIESYKRKLMENINLNDVFMESINLIKENLWKRCFCIHVVGHAAHKLLMF